MEKITPKPIYKNIAAKWWRWVVIFVFTILLFTLFLLDSSYISLGMNTLKDSEKSAMGKNLLEWQGVDVPADAVPYYLPVGGNMVQLDPGGGYKGFVQGCKITIYGPGQYNLVFPTLYDAGHMVKQPLLPQRKIQEFGLMIIPSDGEVPMSIERVFGIKRDFSADLFFVNSKTVFVKIRHTSECQKLHNAKSAKKLQKKKK